MSAQITHVGKNNKTYFNNALPPASSLASPAKLAIIPTYNKSKNNSVLAEVRSPLVRNKTPSLK